MTNAKEKIHGQVGKETQIMIATKVPEKEFFFHLKSAQDLPEFIAFTGRQPRLNEMGEMVVGTCIINYNTFVKRDNFGRVVECLTPEEFKKIYTPVEQKPFADSFRPEKITRKRRLVTQEVNEKK